MCVRCSTQTLPSIENEAAFGTDANGDPLNGDAYSNIWSGETTGSGVPFVYDGTTYHTTGHFSEQYNSWNLTFDTSCLAAHASTGDDWKCRDRMHVLFNHISTPFFIPDSVPRLSYLNSSRDSYPITLPFNIFRPLQLLKIEEKLSL